jgi:hypothetical protein
LRHASDAASSSSSASCVATATSSSAGRSTRLWCRWPLSEFSVRKSQLSHHLHSSLLQVLHPESSGCRWSGEASRRPFVRLRLRVRPVGASHPPFSRLRLRVRPPGLPPPSPTAVRLRARISDSLPACPVASSYPP